MRGERVRDAIRADLRGVVDPQTNTGLHAGADDQRGLIEVALREPHERRGERRDDRAKNKRIDVIEGQVLAAEQCVDHDRELVLGLVLPRRGAPGRDELRFVIHTEDDVRVPDVRGEQRGH